MLGGWYFILYIGTKPIEKVKVKMSLIAKQFIGPLKCLGLVMYILWLSFGLIASVATFYLGSNLAYYSYLNADVISNQQIDSSLTSLVALRFSGVSSIVAGLVFLILSIVGFLVCVSYFWETNQKLFSSKLKFSSNELLYFFAFLTFVLFVALCIVVWATRADVLATKKINYDVSKFRSYSLHQDGDAIVASEKNTSRFNTTRDFLYGYKMNKNIAWIVDYIQETYQCCGFYSYKDFLDYTVSQTEATKAAGAKLTMPRSCYKPHFRQHHDTDKDFNATNLTQLSWLYNLPCGAYLNAGIDDGFFVLQGYIGLVCLLLVIIIASIALLAWLVGQAPEEEVESEQQEYVRPKTRYYWWLKTFSYVAFVQHAFLMFCGLVVLIIGSVIMFHARPWLVHQYQDS